MVLALYGVVAALQSISEFGRVYAAYGGVFIALALAWGVLVDGLRPDRYDLLGALGVAFGCPILDPLVGLGITVAILFIVKDFAFSM